MAMASPFHLVSDFRQPPLAGRHRPQCQREALRPECRRPYRPADPLTPKSRPTPGPGDHVDGHWLCLWATTTRPCSTLRILNRPLGRLSSSGSRRRSRPDRGVRANDRDRLPGPLVRHRIEPMVGRPEIPLADGATDSALEPPERRWRRHPITLKEATGLPPLQAPWSRSIVIDRTGRRMAVLRGGNFLLWTLANPDPSASTETCGRPRKEPPPRRSRAFGPLPTARIVALIVTPKPDVSGQTSVLRCWDLNADDPVRTARTVSDAGAPAVVGTSPLRVYQRRPLADRLEPGQGPAA